MKPPLSAVLLMWSATVAPAASAGGAPHVLIALTAHDQLGDTGQPAGCDLSEVAHPWRAFTDTDYDLTFATPDRAAAPGRRWR